MLNRIYSWVVWAMLVLLLLVAILVAVSRQFLPSIAEHKSAIELFLSERTGSAISIGDISAHWEGRYPVFQLREIRTLTESDAGPDINFSVRQLDAEVDLLASLWSLFPVFAKLSIEQTEVEVHQREGRWGAAASNDTVPANASAFVRQIIAVLSRQPEVSFSNASLSLYPEQGEMQRLFPITFLLNNAAEQHYLHGSLTLPVAGSSESQVEFAIETENLPLDPLAADYRLYAKVSNLGQQLLNLDLIELPFSVKRLDMGAELWGRWNNRRLESVQGALQISQLSFEQSSLENITDSALTFTLQPSKPQQFNVVLSDLIVQNSKAKLTMPFVSADVVWGEDEVALQQINVKEIDLGMLSEWFTDKPYLPESLNDALLKLNAKGSLKNLQIVWSDRNDYSRFQGAADLHQVSVENYYGAPVLKNVTGRLGFTKDTGSIDLNTENFHMGFPDLFPQGWEYSHAKGRVNWVIESRVGHERPVVTVNSSLLNLESSATTAAGRFSMYLPLDREHQTELILLIGMKDTDGRQASLYIPPEVVGESLYQWVSDAIQGGHVNEGMVVLRAGTRRLADRLPPSVQLYFDVSDATVKFQPDWPVISQADLKVRLDEAGLDIKAERGELLNSRVSRVEVQLPAGSTDLSVKATVAGDASDILTVLRTTSLHASVGAGLDTWELSGKHKTDVSLVVPLQGKKTPVVTVSSHVANSLFQDRSAKLAFSQVVGDIIFSSEKGLFSDNLQATLMNAPVSIRIEPVAKRQGVPALTRVYLTGNIGIDALKKQIDFSLLQSAAGSAAINARLDICSGSAACNKLVIDSDLKGISLQAPVPFGKEADVSLPLQIVAQIGITDPVWRYKLGDQLRGVTKAIDGAPRTRISFGGKRPAEPAEPGLWIEGSLALVDLDELKAFLMRNQWWGSGNASSSGEGLKQLVLKISRLNAGSVQVDDVDLVLSTAPATHTAIGFASPKVAGEIRVPVNSGPYQVNLDYLYLHQSKEQGEDSVSSKYGPRVIETQEWPMIDLAIKQLYINSKPFGHWSMRIEPDVVGQLTMKNILGSFNDFIMKGEAGWRLQNNNADSFVNMTLEGGDLGSLLGHFGYKGVIESEYTSMQSDFSWPGYPWDFETKRLNGRYTMLLKKGRIIETGESSNILRLFGILNLNTVVRRLKLNFTDLVKAGVAFDSIRAHYLLNNGVAYSQEPLTMDGPSANINMQGSINIAEQTLDSQMDVVLPLTSNVPIAAVLLGAPQIAGAVFLLDKLIGDKFEKVSTLTYLLSGAWAEPEIKIVTPGSTKSRNLHPGLSGDN